ncbi:MAG TPA: hemolysin family protein [Candidatus Eisenbacteria bacterium]|jgi:CBS domain containing-hemolysin-like protein
MDPFLADLVLLAGVVVLIGLNAYFVAAEFALVTVRWTRVEQLVEEGKFGAAAVRAAVEKLQDAIAATQVGITFASLGLGWIGEPALAHLLEPLFRALPDMWGVGLSHGIAVVLAYLMLAYLHVVLGEQAPKALAIQRAEDVALLVTGPLLAFGRLFRPFIRAIGGSSNLMLRMLRLPAQPKEQLVHSVDELSMLVEESQQAGAITPDEAGYARNVFELSEKTAGDIMVPREKVVTLPLNASEEDVLATARDSAHTRMPVWEGDPDNIVGIVNTKDLFHLFSLKGLVILMDAMYPPLFVSPENPLDRLLRVFRREKRPMAMVRDTTGKFLGIVTLEDVIEEIVGEIEDEHDVAMAHGAVGLDEADPDEKPAGVAAQGRAADTGRAPGGRPDVATPVPPTRSGAPRA